MSELLQHHRSNVNFVTQKEKGRVLWKYKVRALVTGANRGLGKAFAHALLAAGARKVYAGARNPESITDPASLL